MREKVYLLRDSRLLRKYCQRRNRDYRCADIFGCNIACPLAHLRETEYQMNLKNLTLGDAYRSFEWGSIDKEEGRKIIQGKLKEVQKEMEERAREWKNNLHYDPKAQKNFKSRGEIKDNPQSSQKEEI